MCKLDENPKRSMLIALIVGFGVALLFELLLLIPAVVDGFNLLPSGALWYNLLGLVIVLGITYGLIRRCKSGTLKNLIASGLFYYTFILIAGLLIPLV
jgi:hypothetical protein